MQFEKKEYTISVQKNFSVSLTIKSCEVSKENKLFSSHAFCITDAADGTEGKV